MGKKTGQQEMTMAPYRPNPALNADAAKKPPRRLALRSVAY